MRCPYCGSPAVEKIDRNYYVCLDCGEEFSASGYRRPLYAKLPMPIEHFSTLEKTAMPKKYAMEAKKTA